MTVLVEVWSDLICPWCYLGKRRLRTAIERLDGVECEVVYRSYRLDPLLAAEPELDMAGYMAKRYHISRERAEVGNQRLAALAAQDGLTYRLDLMRPVDTLDGHRLLHLARKHGCQEAVTERLLAAVLGEGAVVSDHDTLVRLGAEAGLDPDLAAPVLAGDEYRYDVEADERAGQRHHLESVPFFVVDGTHRTSAAKSVDDLERLLRRALP